VTLPAFATERRRLLSADIACPRGAQQQSRHTPLLLSIDGTDRRTDGRTLERFIDPVLHTVGNGSPYSITERTVPELIPVLCSQPADDVSHEPGDRLSFLSTRPQVTLATLKRAAASFAAW